MKKILIFLAYGILSVLVPLSYASAQEKKLSFGIEGGILNSDVYKDIFNESPSFIKGIANYSVGKNFDIEASYLVAEEMTLPETTTTSGGTTTRIPSVVLNSSFLDLYGLYYVQPSLFLKGGISYSRAESTLRHSSDSSLNFDGSGSNTGLLLGAGIKSGHWRYAATFYIDAFDDDTPYDVLTFSVGYLF